MRKFTLWPWPPLPSPCWSAATAYRPGRAHRAMSFFISSTGSGKGADLGNLAGADALCQRLATAAGAGAKTCAPT